MAGIGQLNETLKMAVKFTDADFKNFRKLMEKEKVFRENEITKPIAAQK